MGSSDASLDRLLKSSDLAKVIPRLSPELLHRVIQTRGLEDSAEFLALATPAQLSRIIDVDVWQARTPGADEQFDVERFGVWLNVLMQSGAEVAAEKVIGLDVELVTAGFSRHTAVFDHAAVASFTTLDGEQVPGRSSNAAEMTEIGGYTIESRHTSAWDAIIDLLAFLQTRHADYFQRLMRACVRLSSGPREPDGFHDLLQDPEQEMFDLAANRETRRDQEGFVAPIQARAFMQVARQVDFAGAQPPESPLVRAYFRGLGPAADDTGREDLAGLHIEPAVMAEVVEVLREAGVIDEPRGLLPAASGEASPLAWIQDYVALHPASAEELAYLANVIVAGCSIQSRSFAPQEASDAAMAICNLGLEAWPAHWKECDLVSAFQVGMTVLHRDVSMYTARRLIAVIDEIQCNDRDTQLRLRELRQQVRRSVRAAEPWRARDALDVIVMLDAPCWAALVALTDECPVLHAAIRGSRDRTRSINSSDYEFISQRSHITLVREFLELLPGRLTE